MMCSSCPAQTICDSRREDTLGCKRSGRPGWLSPEGKWTPIEISHELAAIVVLGQDSIVLERKGWARILDDSVRCDKPLTEHQKAWLTNHRNLVFEE